MSNKYAMFIAVFMLIFFAVLFPQKIDYLAVPVVFFGGFITFMTLLAVLVYCTTKKSTESRI